MRKVKIIEITSRFGLRCVPGYEPPNSLIVNRDSDGTPCGVSWWPIGCDEQLVRKIKRRGAFWSGYAWCLRSPADYAEFIAEAVTKHPEWVVVEKPEVLRSARVSAVNRIGGLAACALSLPLPADVDPPDFSGVRMFYMKRDRCILAIGPEEQVTGWRAEVLRAGATEWSNRKPVTSPQRAASIRVNGWGVDVELDLSDPCHCYLARGQRVNWDAYPKLVPQNGSIRTTRKHWPWLRDKMSRAGIIWRGDDPEASIAVPTNVVFDSIPGWTSPASNGFFLHEYQKRGVEFVASRAMQALIADEMGVGKTAQAIASAEACEAARIVIVCPANARYVWDREVRGWSRGGGIQHIKDQLDVVDSSARWHIVTYDQLVSRTETWRIRDASEEAAVRLFATKKKLVIQKSTGGQKTLKLDRPLVETPDFDDSARQAAWNRMMKRLNGALMAQLVALAGPTSLLVIDEAHRAKNHDSKRASAARRLAFAYPKRILLTGTPLRNTTQDASELLSILDANARAALRKSKGYTIQDVKDYLEHFMIRRLKSDVLPELPPKTRSRVDIDQLNETELDDYRCALEGAQEAYRRALADGCEDWEARREALGLIEVARTHLGRAKVLGGAVADLVANVVENTGSCVVFCAHHDVSDTLASQLKRTGHNVVVVDGRTPQKDRARSVENFQRGAADVFIGGINAAGEAISLTRSQTVVFTELDWVPAALMQAEDRIHRVGQEAQNCQIMHVIAKFDGENLDERMINVLGRKLALIGDVLDEAKDNVIAQGSMQTDIVDMILGRRPSDKLNKLKRSGRRSRMTRPRVVNGNGGNQIEDDEETEQECGMSR